MAHQHPADGPADYLMADKREQTGLLTRFVPDKLKNTAVYRWLLRFTRILQFMSSVVSLGIFSSRLYKVYRLTNSVKVRRGVNSSYGAVQGILSAAVLYTLITMLLSCVKKSANPGGRMLRWAWVLLDVTFVGAFIAVTVLTRPGGGHAGPRHCYNVIRLVKDASEDVVISEIVRRDGSCNLPWGTFVLAIISTFLHAITAAFHEVKGYRHRDRIEHEKTLQQHHETAQPTSVIVPPATIGTHY
ncbi:DNA binding protein [Stemphylium lycopersici]|nr:DNA binding protein [Stemphylium lycopersici]